MSIKDNIGKIIIWGNVGIAVMIYIIATNTRGGMLFGFSCTLLQMIVLLCVAFILSIIHLVTKMAYPTLGKAMKAFWASAALALGISFPACFVVESIRGLSW
jgi:hypothetical protein